MAFLGNQARLDRDTPDEDEVVDRGFSSDENLRYLTRAGGHWIAGERMRDGSPDAKAALARQGRYRSVRDNLRVKEVDLGIEGKRFVVCHNPAEADRADAVLEAVEDGAQAQEALEVAEGALGLEQVLVAERCVLGRDVGVGGRLRIDRQKVAAEERLDGKFLLSARADRGAPRTRAAPSATISSPGSTPSRSGSAARSGRGSGGRAARTRP